MMNFNALLALVMVGFTFNEVGVIRASSSKVVCCHFSSDGTLLATGGHDKKVMRKKMSYYSTFNSYDARAVLSEMD